MKLNGKKFGIEIEFYAPRDDYSLSPIDKVAAKLRATGIKVYSERNYLRQFHQQRGNEATWALGTDGSLSESNLGFGLELATPPLKFASGR